MDVYSPLVHLSFEDFWLIFDHYDWTRHFGLDVVPYGWFYLLPSWKFCLLPLWKCVLQFFLALLSDAFLDLVFLFLFLKKISSALKFQWQHIIVWSAQPLLIHQESCAFFFFKKEVTNSLALEACLASMLSPFSDEYFQACPSKHQLPPLNTSFTSEATDA